MGGAERLLRRSQSLVRISPQPALRSGANAGKPILVAQYFNTSTDCPAVSRLLQDPFLELIATRYLGSLPTLVGTNLWWTFPVKASEADRSRHAHLFHRDVDDFRFFKIFFYITDVERGDGAHVCVVGSQAQPPIRKPGDRWNIRRYTDEEISSEHPANRVVEICAPAGTEFRKVHAVHPKGPHAGENATTAAPSAELEL